MTFSGIIV